MRTATQGDVILWGSLSISFATDSVFIQCFFVLLACAAVFRIGLEDKESK